MCRCRCASPSAVAASVRQREQQRDSGTAGQRDSETVRQTGDRPVCGVRWCDGPIDLISRPSRQRVIIPCITWAQPQLLSSTLLALDVGATEQCTHRIATNGSIHGSCAPAAPVRRRPACCESRWRNRRSARETHLHADHGRSHGIWHPREHRHWQRRLYLPGRHRHQRPVAGHGPGHVAAGRHPGLGGRQHAGRAGHRDSGRGYVASTLSFS